MWGGGGGGDGAGQGPDEAATGAGVEADAVVMLEVGMDIGAGANPRVANGAGGLGGATGAGADAGRRARERVDAVPDLLAGRVEAAGDAAADAEAARRHDGAAGQVEARHARRLVGAEVPDRQHRVAAEAAPGLLAPRVVPHAGALPVPREVPLRLEDEGHAALLGGHHRVDGLVEGRVQLPEGQQRPVVGHGDPLDDVLREALQRIASPFRQGGTGPRLELGERRAEETRGVARRGRGRHQGRGDGRGRRCGVRDVMASGGSDAEISPRPGGEYGESVHRATRATLRPGELRVSSSLANWKGRRKLRKTEIWTCRRRVDEPVLA